MSEKIRWGILSTARINRSLIGPIRQAQRSELVAVASRSLEKAQAYAQEKDIPKAYGSYEALLDDPEIDVVYNPLPNSLHGKWSVKAAKAGKHVLGEKPLVTSLDELDQVEAAAKANQVTIFEAFAHLHHPQTFKIKEMINSGRLGDLRLINSWFGFYLPPENRQNIRFDPNLAGGSLWDVGVYPNSLAIVMAQAGPPLEVWANQTLGASGVDLALVGQMRFSNGVVAQLSCGFCSPFRIGAHLVGSEGIIEVIDPWKPGGRDRETEVNFYFSDGSQETFITPLGSPYLNEVEAMEACVLDGAEPVVPLSLSRDFLGSILALLESARSGHPVVLPNR